MAKRLHRAVCALMIFIFSGALPAYSGEAELMAEIKVLKARMAEMDQLKIRVAELERQVGEQSRCLLDQGQTVSQVRDALIQYRPGEGLAIQPGGLEMSAGATFVLQGTPDANNAGDNKNSSRFDGSWSADIFIQKAFADWGLALLHLEPGQFDTVEPELFVFAT
ncbi:MAG: hypothetical protein WC512_04940 [Candidatus Omnitrophota bacterium]